MHWLTKNLNLGKKLLSSKISCQHTQYAPSYSPLLGPQGPPHPYGVTAVISLSVEIVGPARQRFDFSHVCQTITKRVQFCDLLSEWASEWVSEWVSKWVSERVSEWVNCHLANLVGCWGEVISFKNSFSHTRQIIWKKQVLNLKGKLNWTSEFS